MEEKEKKLEEVEEEDALKAFATEAYEVLRDVVGEAYTEGISNGPYSSAHEGFADILQTMDEIKAHVWARPAQRDYLLMEKSFQSLAAKALRMLLDICRGGDITYKPGKE